MEDRILIFKGLAPWSRLCRCWPGCIRWSQSWWASLGCSPASGHKLPLTPLLVLLTFSSQASGIQWPSTVPFYLLLWTLRTTLLGKVSWDQDSTELFFQISFGVSGSSWPLLSLPSNTRISCTSFWPSTLSYPHITFKPVCVLRMSLAETAVNRQEYFPVLFS